MYINNNKTGCIAVGGSKDNGTYKEIGNKNTPVLEFSLAVGKDENGNTKWFNCKAWNPLASRFKNRITKGEKYLVAGTWEKREHNNKEYYTLIVEYISCTLELMPSAVDNVSSVSEAEDDVPDFMK